MPKWLSIFDTEGLFFKMLFYLLKISVFWAIFAMVKNVLDSCDITYLNLTMINFNLKTNIDLLGELLHNKINLFGNI